MILSALGLLAAGPVLAEPPQVVVDTPVTASLVQQVMGDLGQVQVLLPKGASAHHHQMRPSDARGLQDAGLLVWTGPELTPWLDRAASSVGGDVAQLRLLEVPGTYLRGYDEAHDHGAAHGDDHHGHEGGHDYDHGHDDAHGNVDPHAWLDPENAQLWVSAIAETLEKIDPDNAAAYRQNAVAAAEEIRRLDEELLAQLQPHAGASFVVFHDAYGYFTEHFGLQPAIAVSLGDASTPSAARLAEIRARITEGGAVCAFPEYGSDPKLVQAVTDGGAIRTGDELTPEGGDLEPGPQLYGQILSQMAGAITGCLSE
ncbi:zinc ABC transporter substrate-binding protein [Paracoccus sp. WLY502]|uniref:zinc ABC transporter substrate-binding protein n=1 Tax=Paracoccus yibinensis TaxID=3068891 RepID=UPI002796C362|nr:zinc ABC transporter substrate-binding protein [Paracoccus sp. WLY502]MDQ1899452.1 zinc ABC transporter substrate-binding protein [Paracoccus sp. WLY502]